MNTCGKPVLNDLTDSTRVGYRCTFDRIGRNHNVPPLDVPHVTESESDDDALLEAVYRTARRHCGSREVEVLVNAEEMRGIIIVGYGRPAGNFTITPLGVVR